LTLAGLEVEGIERIGESWEPDKVVVARIARVEPHPNADRLRLVVVDLGDGREQTVVTGAPNVRAGQRVIFGGLGTRYIDMHDPARKLTTLKKSTIRGVASEGMVMSEAELGLSDEHEGIIELPDDAPLGMPARDYLGDAVLELEITPNLVHNFSIVGVAREVAALCDRPLRLPEPQPEGWEAGRRGSADEGTGLGPALVTIDAPELCARYVGAVIRGVTVAPSPAWLQHRLRLVGVRPINNIVDVTNYVMLEYGQPLHAFDLRRLRGGRVIVRRARAGEEMETIDHERRTLDEQMLVIADAERAVALAGVIGGVDSEIGADTTDVLLESANFDMKSIRRTRRALRFRTEASSRFERGIDPELARPAARRAAELMLMLCPGARVERVEDNYPRPPAPVVIDFPLGEIPRLLGVDHPTETVIAVLTRLGFDVRGGEGESGGLLHPNPLPEGEGTGRHHHPAAEGTAALPLPLGEGRGEGHSPANALPIIPSPTPPRPHAPTLTVRVPTWRSDVRIPADLVEEVARIVGYDMLPDTLPAGVMPGVRRDPRLLFEESTRDVLVASGLNEIISYSWTSPEELARLRGGDAWSPDRACDRPLLEIVNPLRPESRTMRPTLLASMLTTLAANLRRRESVRLFEVASVYLPTEPDALPVERRTLALGLGGARAPRSRYDGAEPVDFFDLKGVVEALLGRLGVEATYRPGGPETLHPGRRAELLIGETVAGVLGELHPALAGDWELEGQRVALAELNLDLMRAALPGARRFVPLSRHQPVVQDLAIVVDAATPASAVRDAIVAAAPYLIQRVRLFDLYQGAPVPEGKKSLAFEVTLQSRDRDLPEHEIEKTRGRIEQRLKQELGATLRM
jgi:phenylalanyl-tRNA synthetase beta chain